MDQSHAIEATLLAAFSRHLYAFRPDLCPVPENRDRNARAVQEWRQLAIGQHYGLPTRFLDFTTNLLAALFFAVETPPGAAFTSDSAVWCVFAPHRRKVWEVWQKEDGGGWLTPQQFAEMGSDPPIKHFVDKAFVPEHIDGRIPAQGGVFMCEPAGKKRNWRLHEMLWEQPSTLKIRVPRSACEPLREQLDLVGINRATLFPDLASAAGYLAWAVHQRKRPETI